MKLYWRYKKNGKWTWRAVSPQFKYRIQPVLDEYALDWVEEE